jgi:polyisoprenoid-binding protein YceI
MRPRARAALAAALLLAACAAPVREPAPKGAPAVPEDFPEARYREALAGGKPVFRVDPKESLVVIEVRRAGKLANLGHDHVVASRDVRGYVAPEAGRADLYVALDRLTVDEAPLRKEAGFTTQPSEADIEGTRANMRDKVLEVDKFPFALVRVTGVDTRQSDTTLTVAIALHGGRRTVKAPAKIEAGADSVSVTGRVSFDQTDFGITPYSLLGGAIAVQNRVDLRFSIRARRMSGDD